MKKVFVSTLAVVAGIVPALPSEDGVRPCTVRELCAPPRIDAGDEPASGPGGPRGPLASPVAGSSVTGPTGPSGPAFRT